MQTRFAETANDLCYLVGSHAEKWREGGRAGAVGATGSPQLNCLILRKGHPHRSLIAF